MYGLSFEKKCRKVEIQATQVLLSVRHHSEHVIEKYEEKDNYSPEAFKMPMKCLDNAVNLVALSAMRSVQEVFLQLSCKPLQ